MPRTRSHVVLIALLAAAMSCAARPAAAQNRYDAGSFTIELPQGVRLARTNVSQQATMRAESFTGGDPQNGAVLVIHTVLTGIPQDPALRTPAGVRQIVGDSARRRAALQSRDTSRAAQRELGMLNDTSLAARRAMLRGTRATFVQGSRFVFLGDETREIVTDNRVTLRSPATLRIDASLSLVGTADVSFPRRGRTEFWIVVYATEKRTPESDAAAARMLDSFHVTGAPTSVPVTPAR